MNYSTSINNGLEYLKTIISSRLKSHFNNSNFDINEVDFDLKKLINESPLYGFCKKNQFSRLEFILLMIVLAPQIIPNFLDSIIQNCIPKEGSDLPEIGAVRGKNTRGILPTFQTFLFIVGGMDLNKNFSARKLVNANHFLFKEQIIRTDEIVTGESFINSKIYLSIDYVEFFMFGELSNPRFSSTFPARKLETKLVWDDLVLNKQTENYIQELIAWLNHKDRFNQMKKGLNKDTIGYRALFYGPPGTGKTMTANILGKLTNIDVYRIDLSLLISKYLGETEKNISNLFERAKGRNWILLFDEAEGLFSRRTDINNSIDKYANQEVSYLLQEIEKFPGMIILSTNNFNKIDDAFKRRFQSVVYFPLPRVKERKIIWEKSIPDSLRLEDNFELIKVAEKFDLSGADIVNAVNSIQLRVMQRKTKVVTYEDFLFAIKKEYSKYGKILK